MEPHRHHPLRRLVQERSIPGLKKRRIQYRPEVNEPTEQDKPEDGSQTKLDDRHEQPALKQLPQSWDKKTAKRRDDISGRSLAIGAAAE